MEHPAADRASAYGLERIVVDGNDVDAVYEVAAATVGPGPRAARGPSLIEALTYRHGGHSRADPGKYRPDEEVAAWMARDPIPLYRAPARRPGVAGDGRSTRSSAGAGRGRRGRPTRGARRARAGSRRR